MENEINNSQILEEQEKKDLLSKMIQDEIINSGINIGHKIIQFGCGNNQGDFVRNLSKYSVDIEYKGIDTNESKLDSLKKDIIDSRYTFISASMQEYLDMITDDMEEKVDWFVLSGLLDKPLYEENQYNFLDIILKKCLEKCDIGVSFTFDNSKSDKDYYNIDYITAYIHTGFYRYKIVRFNEKDYVITVYKYFLQTN
jgi:hypothetical protein